MGEKLDFSDPWDLKLKWDFDHKTYKLKPHLITAAQWYLNVKNPPIHGQETASIFQFCEESFESDLLFMYSSVMNAVIKLLLSQGK